MNAPVKGEPIKEFPVKILLLGPPEIYINGKSAAIKRRLNRALFFYLAAHAGQYRVMSCAICSGRRRAKKQPIRICVSH